VFFPPSVLRSPVERHTQSPTNKFLFYYKWSQWC